MTLPKDTKIVEVLCPFEPSKADACLLVAHPQRPFRPKGLMLWGIPEAALVQPQIASRLELVCSFGLIPARWFTTAQSFAEVAKMCEQNQQPPSWGEWSTVETGQTIRLRFENSEGMELPAKNIQALIWGHSIRPSVL